MLLTLLAVSTMLEEPTRGITATDLGISAPALVASGGSAADASGIAQRIEDSPLLTNELVSRRAAADEAVATVEIAYEALAAAPLDQRLRQSYDDAIAAVGEAHTCMCSTANTLKQAAIAELPAEVAELIARCDDPASHGLPTALRVAPCSEDDWRAIRRGLIAERRAARRGEDLDPETAALLNHVRAAPPVIAAEERLRGTTIDAVEDALVQD